MGFCRSNLNLAERKGVWRWRRDQSMCFGASGGGGWWCLVGRLFCPQGTVLAPFKVDIRQLKVATLGRAQQVLINTALSHNGNQIN